MRLTDAQKETMVIMLGRFKRPGAVQAYFRTELGIPLTIQHILAYDPSSPQFRTAEKWRTIWSTARNAYLKEVETVPIANQGFRLQILNEGVLEAVSRGNYTQAAALIEIAAKEVGAAFTNRREIDLKDDRVLADMPLEERVDRVAAIFDRALGRETERKPH